VAAFQRSVTVTYPGSPHFPTLAEQRRNVFTEIRDWLEKYNR
jgi:dipeptidyl aminopeptidase/acylaminoacyl peptidase